MPPNSKTTQQLSRVSPEQKAAIGRAAREAGLDMSGYVLGRLLPPATGRFESLLRAVTDDDAGRCALAELNGFLSGLAAGELAATASPPPFRRRSTCWR